MEGHDRRVGVVMRATPERERKELKRWPNSKRKAEEKEKQWEETQPKEKEKEVKEKPLSRERERERVSMPFLLWTAIAWLTGPALPSFQLLCRNFYLRNNQRDVGGQGIWTQFPDPTPLVQEQQREEFLATFLRANGRRTCVVVGDKSEREERSRADCEGRESSKNVLTYIRR